MTAAETFDILKQSFGDAIKTVTESWAVVEPAKLADICQFLHDDPRMNFALLNDISGVDYLEPDAKKAAKAGFEPHLEVVYHLSSFAEPARRLTLKVMLPRWKDDKVGELPEVPSVAHIWRTADWHERECYDLVGVRFTNHPDLCRILLGDDWLGHPLRKDYEFPLEYHDIRCR
jgi:NADH-quinone oxidoreductase subunit C